MEFWNIIIGFLGTVFSTLFPFLTKKSEESDYLKKFNELRFDIAEAFALYSSCYSSPQVLKSNEYIRLSERKIQGIERLKQLSAKLEAFSETMPPKCSDISVSKLDMWKAALYLRLLALHIDYVYSEEEAQKSKEQAHAIEKNVRNILDLN